MTSTHSFVKTGTATRRASRVQLTRIFFAAVAATVLAYGSASPVAMNISAAGFAALALVSTWHAIESQRVRRVHSIGVFIAAGLIAYSALQALPLTDSSLVNSAWTALGERLGPVGGSVSAAPGMTLDALPELALPFLVFLSALVLFQGDEEAVQLLRALAYFGVGCATFGILQELLFPKQLLLESKKYYLGCLTSTFVNRNTAGTFFGLAFVLNLGLAVRAWREIPAASLFETGSAFDFNRQSRSARLFLRGMGCLIVAVALFLTQSRGAVGATFVAVAVMTLLTVPTRNADELGSARRRWRRIAWFGGTTAAVVGVFALFGGRSVQRMAAQGADDSRWCIFASTWEAIKRNWVLGSGFGTFQDVFPPYRHSECAGIIGVWERAHDFYLEGFLGLGLAFIAAMLVGGSALVWPLLRGIRKRRRLRHVSVSGFAALVLVALHSLVDFSLQIPGFAVYFASTMAAAVTVSLGR